MGHGRNPNINPSKLYVLRNIRQGEACLGHGRNAKISSGETTGTITGTTAFVQKAVVPEIVPVLSLERAIVPENAPGEHHCARIRACG